MTGQGYGQPSSRALAVVVAVANLVVCGGVVAVLGAARDGTTATAVTAVTTTGTTTGTTAVTTTVTTTETTEKATPRDEPSTTTPALPGPDGGFTPVTGPGGMTTHIPVGWPVRTATGPGAMQADDPAGTTTMLRFGGSPAPAADAYDVHADYERRFAEGKQAYTSIRLARTVVRGMAAIDWEFEHDAPEGRRHVRSVYWLHGGHEYFVYASAPTPLWARTGKLLDVMLTYSTP